MNKRIPQHCKKLSSIKARGDKIWCWCHARGCSHGSKLNIDMLIEKLGPNFIFLHEPVIRRIRFRCRRCGRGEVGFIHIPGCYDEPRNMTESNCLADPIKEGDP